MNTTRSPPVALPHQIMDKKGSPDSNSSKERLEVRRTSIDAIVESRPINSQDIIALSAEKISPKRKRKSPAIPWKKPKDMPKRPLSAYNLFFKDQREKLISEGLGFEILAKTIAEKWKNLDEAVKAPFLRQAEDEKKIYESAVAKWRADQQIKKAKEMKESMEEAATVPEKTSSGEPYPANWFQATNQPKMPIMDEGRSYPYYDPTYIQQQTNVVPSVPPIPYPPGYYASPSFPQAISSYPTPFDQVQVPHYYGDIHSIQQHEQLRLHNFIVSSQSSMSQNEQRQMQTGLHSDQYNLRRPSTPGNTAIIHPDAATSSRPQQPLDPEDWHTLRRTLDDDAVEFLKSMRFE